MHNTTLLYFVLHMYHSLTDRPSYMAAGLKVPVPMLPRSFVSERVGKRSRSPRACISKQAFFIKKECRVYKKPPAAPQACGRFMLNTKSCECSLDYVCVLVRPFNSTASRIRVYI